ncbi:TetR/AcrR family transcriptional regulator [Nocardia sp. NBC_01329]|uniref:TetR/AcrR family transcriptional regulator n=1 Tax=Nocardia sp. NBC_01329 TaxID=2903594 RepID=UPI002E153AFB|nr:TetR/AcrR family transcriptional regulator [Nocardia sp. NBC_01329]
MSVSRTREALVQAGVDLLEETGSTEVGLREIARRAGVSHGAPRRWFPTHKALLGAIADVGLRDLARTLAEADGDTPDITGWARAYIEFAWARPAMFALIFRHDLLEGSGAGLRSVSKPLFDRLVGRVRIARADPDPLITATALWVGVHGIAVLSTTGALALAAPGVNIDELIRRVVRDTLG